MIEPNQFTSNYSYVTFKSDEDQVGGASWCEYNPRSLLRLLSYEVELYPKHLFMKLLLVTEICTVTLFLPIGHNTSFLSFPLLGSLLSTARFKHLMIAVTQTVKTEAEQCLTLWQLLWPGVLVRFRKRRGKLSEKNLTKNYIFKIISWQYTGILNL